MMGLITWRFFALGGISAFFMVSGARILYLNAGTRNLVAVCLMLAALFLFERSLKND
jgi:hypothetical protein